MAVVLTWSVFKVVKSCHKVLHQNSFRDLCFRSAQCLLYSHQTFDIKTSEFNDDTGSLEFEEKSCDVSRHMPRTQNEYTEQQYQKLQQPQNPRRLFVAVLGSPNAGKSTLTNSLVKWRVCSVSKKVHTTRCKATAVLNEGNSQIIFLDTPGLVSPEHSKRHQLETTMVTDPEFSLLKADLIAVVVDASNKLTRHCLDPLVLKLLKQYSDKHSILILNKVDVIKSKLFLLEITRNLTTGIVGEQKAVKIPEKKADKEIDLKRLFLRTEMKMKNMTDKNATKDESNEENQREWPKNATKDESNKNQRGWPHFSKVFMLSALNGDGVDEVRDYMVKMAIPSKWIYPSSVVTNQNPHRIGILTIREKLLDCLPQEIPYVLDLEIEMWHLDEAGVLRIVVNIICPKSNYMKLLIGPEGKTISRISDVSRQELSNIFHCDVSLKLIAKSKEIKVQLKPKQIKVPLKQKNSINRTKKVVDDDDDDI